jgi:hypothetical protein
VQSSHSEGIDVERRLSRLGAAIVLAGAAGFVVACFLPFWATPAPLPHREAITLYRLYVTPAPADNLALRIAGSLSLFGGIAVVAAVAAVHLIGRPTRWTLPALAAAVTVWALTWIAMLLRAWGIGFPREIGFWGLMASTAVVIAGTAVSLFTPAAVQSSPSRT